MESIEGDLESCGIIHDEFSRIQYQSFQTNRISESFPPDTKKNFKYIAQVHEVLSQIEFADISDDLITYRRVESPEDIKQLKILHAEWFPIAYSDHFYEQLLHRKNQQSLIAELDLSVFGFDKYIVAVVLYEYQSSSFEVMRFSIPRFLKPSNCLYIQTIGVINEFRGKGIAAIFIQHLQKEVEECQSTQYISLHMVTYNNSGAKFYNKNGFTQVGKKSNFYFIEGRYYDAYVYCLYFKGTQPPFNFTKAFSSLFSCFGYPKNLLPQQISTPSQRE